MDGTLSPCTDTPVAMRGQDLEKIYTLNGSLYFAKRIGFKIIKVFFTLLQ
jgi:CMP-N-acetylneuraminic acid synthetase